MAWAQLASEGLPTLGRGLEGCNERLGFLAGFGMEMARGFFAGPSRGYQRRPFFWVFFLGLLRFFFAAMCCRSDCSEGLVFMPPCIDLLRRLLASELLTDDAICNSPCWMFPSPRAILLSNPVSKLLWSSSSSMAHIVTAIILVCSWLPTQAFEDGFPMYSVFIWSFCLVFIMAL